MHSAASQHTQRFHRMHSAAAQRASVQTVEGIRLELTSEPLVRFANFVLQEENAQLRYQLEQQRQQAVQAAQQQALALPGPDTSVGPAADAAEAPPPLLPPGFGRTSAPPPKGGSLPPPPSAAAAVGDDADADVEALLARVQRQLASRETQAEELERLRRELAESKVGGASFLALSSHRLIITPSRCA